VLTDFNLPRPRARPAYGVSTGVDNFTPHDPASDWSYRIVHLNWWSVTALTGGMFVGWLTVTIRRRQRRGEGFPISAR
jgi:hypothetical protein